MVSLYAIDREKLIWINRYETTTEAVDDARRLWMEDDEPMLFVTGDSGAVLATLIRSPLDPEVCHTTRYDLGPAPVHESHRCRYIREDDGVWESEVTPLDREASHA